MTTKHNTEKLKADDYLLELAEGSDEWLKDLINKIVSGREKPDEEFLNIIYEKFLVSNGLGEDTGKKLKPQSITVPKVKTANTFLLESLTHQEGVNAIEKNATLPFHPKLTVIYGKNGSGKSGFVRLIKRLAGSRTQENVWQNIHSSATQNRCKAKITYLSAGTSTPYQWNGEYKVYPFDRMSVFDGKCIPIYLNTSLGFSYLPYGFELFQALSVSLQELQQKLETDIQDTEDGKPPLDDIFNPLTRVGKLVASIDVTSKSKDFDAIPSWDKASEKDLIDALKEKRDLQNLDQQSEILNNRLQKLTLLEDALVDVQEELSSHNLQIYTGLIKKFGELKKKLSEKKGKTLEDFDIPERDSDEWQSFIESAEEYINHSQKGEYPTNSDNCIYCGQKLSKNAQKLIKLYRELFKEEESINLEDAEGKIDEVLEEIKAISYTDVLPYSKEVYKKLLPKKVIDDVFEMMKKADKLTKEITKALKERKIQKFVPLKTDKLVSSIQIAQTKVKSDIKLVEDTQRDIFKKSRELDAKISDLQDIKKFAKHRGKVDDFILRGQWVTEAQSKTGKLNTRPITELGKKAWGELVSDSFKKRYVVEIKGLDAPTVNLNFLGEYGSQMRKKSMAGQNGIDQFLSEGEQKAIALADFFAELSMQDAKTPVIFDDPATSFDHDRKEKIASRIAEESKIRQVIVFTHDLMFASNLHRKVENPANSDIDNSKASFHNIQSNSGKVGVVTTDYYPGSTKFDSAIKKVELKATQAETLTGDEKTDALKTAYSLLRSAVEKVVEERIFGGVVTRWSEQIQLRNVSKASLNKDKLELAQTMHEEFSKYTDAHNQSDEMIQHSIPTVETLKADILRVKEIAVRP